MWQYGTYFHIFSEFPYTSKLVRRFYQTAFFFLNFHCPREFWMNYETTLCDINPKQAVLRCKKHISPPKKRWLETFQDQKKNFDDRMNSVFVFEVSCGYIGGSTKTLGARSHNLFILMTGTPTFTFTKFSTGFFHRQDWMENFQETYAYWSLRIPLELLDV